MTVVFVVVTVFVIGWGSGGFRAVVVTDELTSLIKFIPVKKIKFFWPFFYCGAVCVGREEDEASASVTTISGGFIAAATGLGIAPVGRGIPVVGFGIPLLAGPKIICYKTAYLILYKYLLFVQHLKQQTTKLQNSKFWKRKNYYLMWVLLEEVYWVL